MLKRGDLILHHDHKGYGDSVFLLISKRIVNSEFVEGESYETWWVTNFGDLRFGDHWRKEEVTEMFIYKDKLIKISINELSKEKRDAIEKFKQEYINTDIV